MNPTVAFVAQGRLHLTGEGEGAWPVLSRFGEKMRERAVRMQQQHAWKSEGRRAKFINSSALWGMAAQRDPAEMRIDVTGVTRGLQANELIYSLDTDHVSGVFLIRDGDEEVRLYHSVDIRPRVVSLNAAQRRVACTVQRQGGISNLAVISTDGSGFHEVTEGDSRDEAPKWIDGSDDELVYQSAGVARDRNGVCAGLGPYRVEKLNLATGSIDTIAEESRHDLLTPQVDAAGNLYFIRRPYRPVFARASVGRAALDTVLLPFRLLNAVAHWLNLFVMLNTRQPLNTPGEAQNRRLGLQQMLVWGNLINAERILRKSSDTEPPSLVPKTWELVRQAPDGSQTVLLNGVLSFDLGTDGTIVYTNGSGIFVHRGNGRAVRLVSHHYVEHVVALS